MHHDTLLLASIAMAIVVAFFGGIVARKLGLPALVGYLVGGVLISPFTPGFQGDSVNMNQLAEIGVIFMMFGVGLHFSLKDLWEKRNIAIPGALLQMAAGTALGAVLVSRWGWSIGASVVLGISISIASTVVLLRALTDAGILQSPGGRAATAWLILEDLATVLILVLLPVLFGKEDVAGAALVRDIGLTLVKTGVFVALMMFVGTRVIPWILTRIAKTRSRELFLLAVVALALGTAFGAAEIFSISFALGAFLAGVVVNESSMGHQSAAEILPFQELFSILFFVSVGMLIDPRIFVSQWPQILALTVLVVAGKWLINLLLCFALPSTIRTALVVAAGLAQIGEFSFIVGQAGLYLGILTGEQYSLILAAAILSILLNPFIFRATPHIERWMTSKPRFRRLFERGMGTSMPEAGDKAGMAEELSGHVVIVGYGRVGSYTAHVLEELGESYLVIESDISIAEEAAGRGVPMLFGDASNSEILKHASLEKATALVVTSGSDTSAQLIVAYTHEVAPSLSIIARASTQAGVLTLLESGAHHVVQPEMEGGLEIMRLTLLDLGKSPSRIQEYADAVRTDAYAAVSSGKKRPHALDQLITTIRGVGIQWITVSGASGVVGQTLASADIRAASGASVVAILRNGKTMANPSAQTVIEADDLVGVMGDVDEVEEAFHILVPPGSCTLEDDEADVLDSIAHPSSTEGYWL
ncbi:MAG: cation:proton antiporter [Coriobacteriia bacterium]|nr:cation:proton antiporter [Coriobacteriia bacterium]